jgi:hypothetical protein
MGKVVFLIGKVVFLNRNMGFFDVLIGKLGFWMENAVFHSKSSCFFI